MIATQYQTATDNIAATVPPTSAYMLGVYAAQLGEDCHPAQVLRFRHEQREFCAGYRAAIAIAKANEVQQ